MKKNFIALSSISMDLERVAMGLQRGSENMANRFLKEAFLRKDEIDTKKISLHVKKIIRGLEKLSEEKNVNKKAEDALMYSILFQNAALQ